MSAIPATIWLNNKIFSVFNNFKYKLHYNSLNEGSDHEKDRNSHVKQNSCNSMDRGCCLCFIHGQVVILKKPTPFNLDNLEIELFTM